MKKDLFTTGEFAGICNVNKQTLFYYDREGIFCPEVIAENGYRYYSYTQIETFTVITMLRDLGVSVREIKAHMEHPTPQALIELMESKKAEIDKKLKALEWSRKYIDNRIRITREGLAARAGEIIRQEIADRYLITSDYTGTDVTVGVTRAIGDHLDRCAELGLYSACPIGCMIPTESVNEQGYRYAKFYTGIDKTHAPAEAIVASGGSHLVIYDDHGYENVWQNCRALLEYGREHGLNLGKNIFEDVILDDLSTKGYFNYLVKLSVRIDR